MYEQPGLFDERRPLERSTAPARRSDPSTSHQAAKLPFQRESQRHRLLTQYGAAREGLTDEEAAEAAEIFRGCPWKRCSELRQDIMIAPTSATRVSSMGAAQDVCIITGKGRAVLEQLNQSKGEER